MPRGAAPSSAGGEQRDDCAFEALVREHQGAVYGFALRLSGSPQDAEDIAQDTFVRAYSALPRYDEERVRTLAARPWLLQIALNVFRNRVRVRRPPTLPMETSAGTGADGEDGPALLVEGDERDRPEVAAEAHERQRELGARLAALPEHFRVAVVLRHVDGLGYGEIAGILGQPVGTVKAHVHRGTRLLRAALEAELERERSEVGMGMIL